MSRRRGRKSGSVSLRCRGLSDDRRADLGLEDRGFPRRDLSRRRINSSSDRGIYDTIELEIFISLVVRHRQGMVAAGERSRLIPEIVVDYLPTSFSVNALSLPAVDYEINHDSLSGSARYGTVYRDIGTWT